MEKGVAKINVSAGELLDRISILEIKAEKIESADRQDRICRELKELNANRQAVIQHVAGMQDLFNKLKAINLKIWTVEDKLRLLEHKKMFDETFIRLAIGSPIFESLSRHQ